MDGVDNCILTSEGGNNLEGNIPLELGNLSNLTFLNFSYNDLSGSIPWELGNLSNLTYLSLHDNQLNGNIPSELDNLSNLTSLHLSFNELSGNIPPELGNLSNLASLSLSRNQLSGSIPPELGNLSNLASLSLYNNQLSGCYDSNVLSLCDQLISYFNNNESISDGNNFDAPWEDFCATQAGICCTTGSLILNISVDNNISCNDGSDGQVTATPSGGTLPYTYTWSASANNQTTATVTILPAGTYTVTVTDANSCAATAQVEIIEPPSLNLTIDINNISCAGGSDGSATATPQGGTPDATGNYTYQWSANTGGQTTAIALNLSAGTYIVTVTDANNCEIFETVSISEPAILSIDNISITDTSCGSANGTATVTASDGILPYTYQWNDANAQTTETAIGLAAGDYNVTLTDMNGCFAIASVNVSDSGTPTAPIATNNGPDCPGGTVILSVTNPVPDAIYTWYSASTNSVLGMGSIVTLFGITMADAGVYYVVAEVSNCTSDLGETTVEVEDCNGPCATEPTIMLPCDDGNVCTTNDSTLVLMSDNSITCEPCEGIENTCDTPGATITLICDDMNPSTINDSITVLICDNNIVCQSCMGVEIQDLVFPGNFDNDAIADGKDLLYWGVAYGYTGPARTNATTDWIPQYNDEDWLTSINGVNSKHQDANGDGVVNMLDFEILEANYNETYGNNPFIHQPTDMMFVIEALEVDDATNQIRFDLHIASDTPVSTHGISTVIDLSAINYYEVQVDTSDSSLHPDAYIYKDNGGTFDIALTRTDKIDQVIDGPIVSLVVMVKDLHLTTPAININDGYMMSAIGELTSVGGSSLHGRIDAPISLGVNHVYCNDKGSAEVYVSSVPLYSCVWSTGDTTTSINGLDVGSYSVTVNDDMGSVTVIDFDITWAFTPLHLLL